jgi:hypothetical protein
MVHVALHTRASDDEACSMAITLPMLIALDAALMYQPEKLLWGLFRVIKVGMFDAMKCKWQQ